MNISSLSGYVVSVNKDEKCTKVRLSFKGHEGRNFITLKCFNRSKENADKLSKDDYIVAYGPLRIDEYEKDGERQSFPYILVDEIHQTTIEKRTVETPTDSQEEKKAPF